MQKKSVTKLWEQELDGDLNSLDFSPDDHFLALGCDNGVVRFLDEQGVGRWEVPVGQPVRTVGILPVKKRVMVLDEYSRISAIDFSGKILFQKNFESYWSALEVKSGHCILWGWKSKPVKMNAAGKVMQELNIPHPWRVLRCGQRKDLFWVVHNQVCLGLYNSKGTSLWLVNNPAPVNLSRTHGSDVVVDDSGELLAVSCFDRGLYIYDADKRSLGQLDLETPVTHAAVSGDGKFLLVSDALRNVYLVSRKAEVLWQQKLPDNAGWLRLDRKGTRAVVCDEQGVLTMYRFSSGGESRSEFLELHDWSDIPDQKEIWTRRKPSFAGRGAGTLRIAANGRSFVYGEGKTCAVFDANGDTVWQKSFMENFQDAYITNEGRHVVLYQPLEIFLRDFRTEHETHLTFYDAPLKELAVDAEGRGVLAWDRNRSLTFYDPNGKKIWKSKLNKDIARLALNCEMGRAVFQGAAKTLYFLDLKTLKVRHTVLGGTIRRIIQTETAIYVGGEAGRCHALNAEGQVQWRYQIGEPVGAIWPFQDYVGFVGKQGTLALFEKNGLFCGKGKLRSASSALAQHGPEVYEVVAQNSQVRCYKLFEEPMLWKLNLAAPVRCLAVSRFGNRMVLLDSKNLSLYQVITEPGRVENRSSFLEL